MAYGDHIRRRAVTEETDVNETTMQSSAYEEGVLLGNLTSTECHNADNVLKQHADKCSIKNSEEKGYGKNVFFLNEDKILDRSSNDTHGLKIPCRFSGGNNKPSISVRSKMRHRQRRKRQLPAWMQFPSDDGRDHN